MKAAVTFGRLPACELKVRDRSPLSASLVARLRASALDQQRARGVKPWRECLLEDIERPPVVSAVVRPCRGQVLEAQPLIMAVAARLRSDRPVDARGMARILGPVTDGAGPCYARSCPHALDGALQSASQWLDAPD